jgi:hypothetical protein
MILKTTKNATGSFFMFFFWKEIQPKMITNRPKGSLWIQKKADHFSSFLQTTKKKDKDSSLTYEFIVHSPTFLERWFDFIYFNFKNNNLLIYFVCLVVIDWLIDWRFKDILFSFIVFHFICYFHSRFFLIIIIIIIYSWIMMIKCIFI